MALLNYANNISEIEEFLSASSGTSNYLKLAFTQDGHIITHGVDYTPDFTVMDGPNGGRGLVKGSTNNPKEILRGNNTWSQLLVTDLPCSTNLNEVNDETIPTTKAVVDYIGSFVRTAETMRFMGVIRYTESSGFETMTKGSYTQGLPTSWVMGDTYRIGVMSDSAGVTFSGQKVEPGDMLVCINDGGGDMQYSNDWSIIQTNVTKQSTFNGTPIHFYATDSIPIKFHAPTVTGTNGNILISRGENEPKWGSLQITPEGKLNILDNEGQLVGNSYEIIANKVHKPLTAGIGINFTDQEQGFSAFYDGKQQLNINVSPADTTTLGAVIIDTDHGSRGGEMGYPTISIEADGTLYLTKENIENALGYSPSTMYDVVSTEKMGYAPKITLDDTIIENTNYRVLSSDESGNPYWRALPLTAFSDTKRDIFIAGNSIGEAALNFIPTGDIYVKADPNNDEIVDLSFGLSWYNINTRAYEYDEPLYDN